MKRHLILFILLLCCGVGFSQKDRPGWIVNTPKPGNGYLYVVEYAIGKSQEIALNSAVAKVYKNTAMRLKSGLDLTEINQAIEKGSALTSTYNIPVQKVCEYSERISGGYKVYVLCQVAKDAFDYPNWEHFSGCNDARKYTDWVAGLESAFLPGLGQMTKRRGGSGTLFLLSEMSLAAGAISTKCIAQKKLNILKGNNVDFVTYSTNVKKYNNLKLTNNIFLWTLLAVHVGNIVHAVMARPKYKDYSFYPTTIYTPSENNMAYGVGLTISF